MTKNEFMETVKDATLAILRKKDETIDAIISNVTFDYQSLTTVLRVLC